MKRKIKVLTLLFVIFINCVCHAYSMQYSSNIINSNINNNGPGFDMVGNTNNSQNVSKESFENITAVPQVNVNQDNSNKQLQNLQMIINTDSDIPSGYTSSGFAYGFARLAQNLSQKRGDVDFISATKVKDKQYIVICSSNDNYSNGAFQVDIFQSNETELKSGYQIWFGLYDENAKKIGTAQAKRIYN